MIQQKIRGKVLIKEIKDRKLHLCIITNGVLVSKYAKLIVNAGVDELSLSIDGPEEVHDDVRNMKGAFSAIKKGVDEVNRLKAERKSRFPIINIVCTISDRNFSRLDELVKVAEDMKAHTLNFHHLIHTDGETVKAHNAEFKELFGCESKDWEGFVLPNIRKVDAAVLTEKIRSITSKKYPFLVSFYPNFGLKELKDYYSDPKFISKSYPERCLSPWIVSYIYPDGSVLPCHSLGYSAGNINEKSFLDIWNGEEMRKFRKELKKRKNFKVCPKCTEKYRY